MNKISRSFAKKVSFPGFAKKWLPNSEYASIARYWRIRFLCDETYGRLTNIERPKLFNVWLYDINGTEYAQSRQYWGSGAYFLTLGDMYDSIIGYDLIRPVRIVRYKIDIQYASMNWVLESSHDEEIWFALDKRDTYTTIIQGGNFANRVEREYWVYG